MKNLSRTLRSRRGMTLTETLAAIAILTLLATLLLTGSRSAMRVYAESTFTAESRNVADTINTALSDVLRYATAVTVDKNGSVTAYTNEAYGVTDGRLCIGGSDGSAPDSLYDRGMIYLKRDGADAANSVFLLSNLSYSGLYAVPVGYDPANVASDRETFTLTYADGVFSGSYRLYDPVHKLLSEPCAFSFRTVNDLSATV